MLVPVLEMACKLGLKLASYRRFADGPRGSEEGAERDLQAAQAAGREPEDVTLIAVSKTFDGPEIIPVIEAGQRVFGENRVQEAKSKWPALKMRWPDLELHLIGPLQSNKAAEAVQLFDAIHTVDRPKIAEAIATEMKKQAKPAQALRAGEHRPRAAEGGNRPGRGRCLPEGVPRGLRPRDLGPDVHSTRRGGPRARISPCWPTSPSAMASTAQHGHERRLCRGDRRRAPPMCGWARRSSAPAASATGPQVHRT